VIRSITTERDVKYGDDFDTGYGVVLRVGVKIGNRVCIYSNSVIDEGAEIGDDTTIHCLCYVAQFCIVGADCFLAPGVVLGNDKYPVRRDRDKWEPAIVHDGARIGLNSTILPGVEIGEGAVIGAGSVVTKNVPPGEVWYGVPARKVGTVEQIYPSGEAYTDVGCGGDHSCSHYTCSCMCSCRTLGD
jgi:UDP-3-O-[3-hydroxymyristoyl] glucosamine N-acyltransferase